MTTSTYAIVGLILSIVSWVLCPIVPAIVALVLAAKSTQEIEASGGRVDGTGLNTATRVISWLNIGLIGGAIAIALVITLVALVIAAASSAGA